MCFEFSSCFGGVIKDDYGGERSNQGGCSGRGRGHRGYRENGNGYNAAAADHKPATAYDHQRALDEHGRKAHAHHDGGVKPDHASVVAATGGHGYYAAYMQDKAHEAPKLPAWHNNVVDDAGYAYNYNTARLRHQAAPDHREHAAMDYHHYPTTTTTLVRY
ncbi:hypothetical protein CFC21_033752 [Triticum aestivum]|uniref:Uncharacterized protein n=2 Tax=Triticum aestivum TaxID=4565 RepID=A0A9R1F2Z3_WHEAT|nr:uncharacterized protein LOC119273762 [Triticum dicoccoides]XP_044336561.1 uncharacterized protein LOC123057712 [Triticum aestivum]KAF7020687.1 hypothetical protein CFC21_033752 [Triticum aestivum]